MARQNSLDRSGESNITVSTTMNQEQVKALKRAIQDVGKGARQDMRRRLKEVGVVVQTEIKSRTPVGQKYGGAGRQRVIGKFNRSGNSLRTSIHTRGLLKRSTKLKIGSLSVAIYNDAKAAYKGGYYRYGKRIEFDPTLGGRHAFFYPGYEDKKAQTVQMFDKVLDDAVKTYMTD